MKQIGKKLTLLLMVLLSVVLMLVGVVSLRPMNAAAEDQGSTQTTQTEPIDWSSSWYEFHYSENNGQYTIQFLLNGKFQDYLDAGRGDISTLRTKAMEALRQMFITGILNQYSNTNPGGPSFMPMANDPTSDPDYNGVWEMFKDGNFKGLKNYIEERLSEPGELQNYREGQYDALLEYAVSEYVSSQQEQHPEADVSTFYDKIEDAMDEVMDTVVEKATQKYTDYVYSNPEFEEWSETQKQTLIENWKNTNTSDEAVEAAKKKVSESVEAVKENGGQPTVTTADLLQAINGVYIDGRTLVDSENGKKYPRTEGLRYLLSLIPRPSTLTEEDLKELLNVEIKLDTTYGEIAFNLKFGFYGDTTAIVKAANKLAEYVDFTKTGDHYDVTVRTPAVFTELMQRALESNQFSDKNKNLLFSVFSKTPDQIYDKAKGYTYEQLVEFLKSPDYANWFSHVLSAEWLNNYFGDYLTSLHGGKPVTPDTIDHLIDKVHNFFMNHLGRLEELTVEEVENFLKKLPGFGSVTVPAKLHNAAEKLLNFAKKVDWEKYDAAYIRELLKDPDQFNKKIIEFIDKWQGTFADYYDTFLTYLDRLYNLVPERFKDGTIVDLYKGTNAGMGAAQFAYDGAFHVDVTYYINRVKEVLANHGFTSIADALGEFVTVMGQKSYDVDLSLELNVPNLYKVTYLDENGETAREGFLPEGINGATIATLSNLTKIDSYDVLGWLVQGGDKYVSADKTNFIATMPAKDVVLVPVTDFEVNGSVDENEGYKYEATYDGNAHTLKVDVLGVNTEYTYQWYCNDQLIEGAIYATFDVKDVGDSDTYYVIVTDTETGYSVQSKTFTVEIEAAKLAVTDIAWSEEKSFVFDGEAHSVTATYKVTLNGEELTDKADIEKYLTISYENAEKTEAGKYTAKLIITLNANIEAAKVAGNYVVTLPEDADLMYEWEITPIKYVITINDPAQWMWPEKNPIYNGDEYEWDLGSIPSAEDGMEDFMMLMMSIMITVNEEPYDLMTLSEMAGNVFPFGIMPSFDGDVSKTDHKAGGNYIVKFVLGFMSAESPNYVFELPKEFESDKDLMMSVFEVAHEWNIDPLEVNLNGLGIDYLKYSDKEGVQHSFESDEFVFDPSNTKGYSATLDDNNGGTKIIKFLKDHKVVPATSDDTLEKELLEAFVYEPVTFRNANGYSFTITLNDPNYVLVDAKGTIDEYKITWKVVPLAVTVDSIEWKGETEGTINKVVGDTKINVEFTTDPESAHDYITYSLSYKKGDEAVDAIGGAGDYTVTVKFAAKVEADAANYVITIADGVTQTMNVHVTEETEGKTKLDASGLTWAGIGEFTFDGTPHTVTFTGIDDIKDFVEVTYTKDGTTTNVAPTNAGEYKVSIRVIADKEATYEIQNLPAPATLTIKEKTIKITVSLPELEYTGQEQTAEPTVNPTTIEELTWTIEGNTGTEVNDYTATITFTLKQDRLATNYIVKINGEVVAIDNGKYVKTLPWKIKEASVTPGDENWEVNKEWPLVGGDVIVKLTEGSVSKKYDAQGTEANLDSYLDKIKTALSTAKGDYVGAKGYDIHFADASGAKQTVTGKFEVTIKIPASLKNCDQLYIVHIDDEGNVTKVNATKATDAMKFTANGFSIYAVVGYSETTTPAAGINWLLLGALGLTALILLIALIVLIVFAAKVKNAEANVAEQPAEEAVEGEEGQPIYVQGAAAETAEEAEGEEAVSEEVPGEASEEAAAQAAEETAPVEEGAEEEPFITPIYRLADPTPEAVVETMTIIDRSFTARLAQAEEPVKSYYNELKNYILSYKNVRSRISWGYDSFSRGRTKICKLQFKGKSLFMYIALDPETLDEKYHHKNVSDVAKYADVPTKLKIRSNRSLKYAKLFVDMLMQNLEIEQGEIENNTYTLNYKSLDELKAEGLVREKEVAAPDFWNVDANDVAESYPLAYVELPEEKGTDDDE